jgi:putative ABC transport system permease protein
LLTSQLWKTSPNDVATLVAVAIIIGLVGLCACWIPARRALRVNPIVALRHE